MSEMNRGSNLERLKKAYEAKDDTGFKFWKPRNYGKYTVRFLPPWEKDGLFYKEAKQHKIGESYVFCPRGKNEPCPICELYKKLYDIGTDEAVALAKDIKPRKQYLYNIVLRDEDGKPSTTPKKVLLYMSGKKLYDSVLDYFFDEEYGDLTDVEKGFDFVIKKEKGDGDFPSYDSSRPRTKPSRLAESDADIEEILSSLRNLDAEVEILSYPELKKMLDQFLTTEKADGSQFVQAKPPSEAAKDDEDEDEAPTPSGRNAAPASSGAAKKNPEELDEFEKSLLAQVEK